jgi:2,3-bisphosphoglycerate-dependent phosphoglycerate mutase
MLNEREGGSRFYIVRHGATKLPENLIIAGGNSDVPLSDYGKKQAKNLIDRFDGIKIDRIVSSNMIRAQDTVAPVAQQKGIEVVTTPHLRERVYGEAIESGHIMKDIINFWRTGHEYRKNTRLTHDMETDQEMMGRVLPVFHDLAKAHPNETILVMAHCDVITTFMQAAVTHEHSHKPHNMKNIGQLVVDFKDKFELIKTQGIFRV